MQVLSKFKKNFDAGFKDFVKGLDILPTQTINDLMFNGLLEDPVYLKWALINKLSFDYFLKLTNKDVLKIFQTIEKADTVLLHALKNHPEENNFIKSNLPQFILGQYLVNRETEKITVSMQTEARKIIMREVYRLMEIGNIDPVDWKLPPAEVLSGISHTIDNNRHYKQYYDDGVLAIEGRLDEKGKRTGTWKSFYPTGPLHSEGNYSDGQKHGDWNFYYINGNLKSKGFFCYNMKHGKWRVFDSNCNGRTVNYINGKA